MKHILFFLLPLSLLFLTSCTGRKEAQYREALSEARRQNLAYEPVTGDSLLRCAVDYFDRHGTANDRLLSRYLLGCAYRDLHEAPLALITWEDAVACADTFSPDCDYATLFRVYGQMAEIYFRQYMPEKEMEARGNYNKYALLASDTLNYIKGLLQLNDTYLALGDTNAIFHNIKRVRQLCLERGLKAEAAQVYPSAIQIALDNQQFDRAGVMMRHFEEESGLFDKQGNIELRREKYYYDKGRYYAGLGKLDSAEYQFRRLLSYDNVAIDGYHALLSIFQNLGQTDSIIKYTYLYEQALADYLNQKQIQSVAQAKGMYDYTRQQKNAQEQKQKKDEFQFALISVLSLGLLIGLVTLWIFQKKKEEQKELLRNYQKAKEELITAKREIVLLQHSLSSKEVTKKLIKEKERKILDLEKLIRVLHNKFSKPERMIQEPGIGESEIVKTFQTISRPHFVQDGDCKTRVEAREATYKEWQLLTETLQTYQPIIYLFIQKHNLSDLKFKVCILSYLGFDNGAIATLTNANKGSISNARTFLAKELFGLESALELDEHLHNIS